MLTSNKKQSDTLLLLIMGVTSVLNVSLSKKGYHFEANGNVCILPVSFLMVQFGQFLVRARGILSQRKTLNMLN